MQIQSYFHLSHPAGHSNPHWSETPLSRTRPTAVEYAGEKQGIAGVVVMGSQINPNMLREVIEGAIVAVVEVESPKAFLGSSSSAEKLSREDEQDGPGADDDVEMGSDEPATNGTFASIEDGRVIRTPENLPYLFAGSGSCTPLDPKSSNCLGLALVRSVNTASQKLELSTPISSSRLYNAIEQGYRIVLVRGQLDNPNWAISEGYHAARAAERQYQQSVLRLRKNGDSLSGDDLVKHNQTMAVLRERIRRAGNVPWMTVVEDNSRRQREEAARREKSLWKLRKKAYPGSESETDW
jgi:polynucleotide 5'-hydroxyl-kinase GRC3/NOL9